MTEVIIQSPDSGPDAPVVVEEKVVAAAAVVDPSALPSDDTPEVAAVADPAEFVMPEKFAGKTAEEIAKAYTELEKSRGTKAAEVVPPVKAADPKIAVPADVQAATDVIAKAGLKFDDLNAQFAEKGVLEETSYAALAKQGIPKAMVDGFIAGQVALGQKVAAATATAAHTAAGGADKYAEAVAWAAKGGFEKPAILAFNKAIETNDPAMVTMAVQGLTAAFTKAGGSEPSNITATTKGGGAGVYATNAQVVKDMSDPRYETDAVFRDRVVAKIARSNVL